VRANLVYRQFTRIGGEKVPDDRTMRNLGRQLGPEAIEQLHRRVVEIAQEKKIATGSRMRVDTAPISWLWISTPAADSGRDAAPAVQRALAAQRLGPRSRSQALPVHCLGKRRPGPIRSP
jgi:hypothetical protein